MVKSNQEPENPNYTQKFGLVNIMTDDEKKDYKAFNDRLLTMDYQSLMKLNMGTAGDVLTTEQRDLVAWQIKIRELDALKKRGIDPSKEYSVDNMKAAQYDPTIPNIESLKVNERNRIEGMSLEALERAKKLVDDTPVVISQDNMHNMNGGGINMACNQYIVVDNNGNEVRVNNRKIQELYRKRYIKAMSEVTGFDFTKYNMDGSMEEPDLDYNLPNNTNPDNRDITNPDSARPNINESEYEDD